ncbi:MAG: DEAD/DEAH box helicase, partial [Chloroflexaceae bacterium]|nr:DEAD/DEAH box helicase [Chloroflexaceae bacterium]
MDTTLTPYHAAYLAYTLGRRFPSGSNERLTGAVASAQVDLNPHQVDAALFAFKSPFSKGVLLADEVGLGKTIEAGLVLAQKWAEGKRRLLVITPSNLRKQWYQELTEKFFLPCTILETHSYQALRKQGHTRPFEQTAVCICSYQFARSKEEEIRRVPWDAVVIDEAHRLRNVYKPSNVIGNTLKRALSGRNKLLLTATPLQNSLLELYGLVSFIDEHAFGDLKSFRDQFANLNQDQVFETLKARLKPLCHRTLRRQVAASISYTRRLPLVEDFTPNENAEALYDLVTDYLRRPDLQALPVSQRSLITLVLRKLLASSTFAIAGALASMAKRLRSKLGPAADELALEEALERDYEALDETAEEWSEDAPPPLSEADRAAIEREIRDLDDFTSLAASITQNAKGNALLKALGIAFAKARELGAAEKAIIFTESRRTQEYLVRLLADSPFADGIVLFNGSNDDAGSRQIYNQWLQQHRGTDRVTGSRTGDMRSALVDYFREQGRIMIATEAGAEGINLQFCSLVVNYDLPWNPQRIEQRIGRCHRYGQKHDVVVVNFINRKNAADERVYKLLNEKFKLFDGVFGTSDEVLGAIESGVDFEKRIAEIYQRCRHPDEITQAFDELQRELSGEISASMTRTRQQLLENFDDEVREKLRVRDEQSKAFLSTYEAQLMQLTRYALADYAEFRDSSSFVLHAHPFATAAEEIPLGLYELPRRTGDAHLYRVNHPLAVEVLKQAKQHELPLAVLHFDYAQYDGKISSLEPFRGQSGWLMLSQLSVESLDQAEDRLLAAAITDRGEELGDDVARRLMSVPATSTPLDPFTEPPVATLTAITQRLQAAAHQEISQRNARFFDEESQKLDGWA